MAELLGAHGYQLDPKGRISLRAKFREVFADGAYLTLGHDGCLFAFPTEEWDRRAAEVEEVPLSDPDGRAYSRMFFGNAERVELDGQGRLVVPLRLRQRAGIGREVVVVGLRDRMEVWDREAWDRYDDAHAAAYQGGLLTPRGRRQG